MNRILSLAISLLSISCVTVHHPPVTTVDTNCSRNWISNGISCSSSINTRTETTRIDNRVWYWTILPGFILPWCAGKELVELVIDEWNDGENCFYNVFVSEKYK